MIIGRFLRYQDSDLLCRMYYCGDREVFEFYREYDKSIPVSRREHPFLESLLLFLEMDHASDFPQLNQIESDLTEYSIYKEQQYAENALQELQELSKRHIYYEILNMACSQQIRNANNCHDQPLDVLNGLLLISRNLNMYMYQTHQFLEHVLDIDRAGRHPKDQMQQLYEHDVGGCLFVPIPSHSHQLRTGKGGANSTCTLFQQYSGYYRICSENLRGTGNHGPPLQKLWAVLCPDWPWQSGILWAFSGKRASDLSEDRCLPAMDDQTEG